MTYKLLTLTHRPWYHTFAYIWKAFRFLPRPIQTLCNTQFFAWMGWFPFLFYRCVRVFQPYIIHTKKYHQYILTYSSYTTFTKPVPNGFLKFISKPIPLTAVILMNGLEVPVPDHLRCFVTLSLLWLPALFYP
jgi:hypothetical protein